MRLVDDGDYEEYDQSEGDWYVRDYVIAPRDQKIAELQKTIEDLEDRILTLQGDIDYYCGEIARTW